MAKNKKYYKKNNYYKKPEEKKEEKTYKSLVNVQITDDNTLGDNNVNKLLIVKYIAVSVVLFAILIGSLLLFRQM